MIQRRNVGEDHATDLVQRSNDGRRRPDARNDDFDLVPDKTRKVLVAPFIANDQVWTIGRRESRAVSYACLYASKPIIKFFRRARVFSRKGPDHARAACGDNKIGAGYTMHGRRDHR
jgi:hypothetical protein